MSENLSTKDFIEIQRKAAQLEVDAYEEDEDWCPTKTSRLLDACGRLEIIKQQRDDLVDALNSWVKVFEFHKGYEGLVENSKAAIANCKA